jgi:hypothetical protein
VCVEPRGVGGGEFRRRRRFAVVDLEIITGAAIGIVDRRAEIERDRRIGVVQRRFHRRPLYVASSGV